jgi:hypothetical protein
MTAIKSLIATTNYLPLVGRSKFAFEFRVGDGVCNLERSPTRIASLSDLPTRGR